jgi:hypothetical protein
MGLIAFVKEAGAFLFGHSAGNPAPASTASQLTVEVLAAVGITVENLAIELNDGTATVRGSVGSQADRMNLARKNILACAAFTRQENCRFAGSYALGIAQQALHHRASRLQKGSLFERIAQTANLVSQASSLALEALRKLPQFGSSNGRSIC